MSTVRMRFTISGEYDAVPDEEAYGTTDPVEMALVDQQELSENPGSFLEEATEWRVTLADRDPVKRFRDEIEAALQPGRWRGFDGPDGVTKDEVIQDVGWALDRFDKAIKEES